jgi:hypothetical protein
MVGPQTKLALNRRALNTINCFERWTKHLREEMEKQNIKLFAKQEPVPGPGVPSGIYFKTDDSMTMTLTRGDVRGLIVDLTRCTAELRQFTWRP